MASEITSVGDEEIQFLSSLLSLNLRRDLEENLFDNNSTCEDWECDSAYVKHRSEIVFDKSSYEEMSKMCAEHPVRTKQTKKKIEKKEGGKLTKTTTNNYN